MQATTGPSGDTQWTQASFWKWIQKRPGSDRNHYELINGRIVVTPPAGWPHGRLDAKLNCLFNQHVEEHSLGIVLGSSAGYDLPSGDTVEPDVSFISAERFALGPPPTRGKFLAISPTLVVEILSAATSRRDRTEKKPLYERNGIAEYWIVDPVAEAVTVFYLTRRRYGPGRKVTAGRVPSRVLPRLNLSIDQIVDLGV